MLSEADLDRAIAETQESHIASLRRQWNEQMPEPEPERRTQPSAVPWRWFFYAIGSGCIAAAVLLATNPGGL